MEGYWVGILGIVVFLLLMAIGVRIGIALGITGMGGLVVLVGLQRAVIQAAEVSFFWPTNYLLMQLPLFIVMGLLASEGGVIKECYVAINNWFGGIKGGVLAASIIASAFFGTISGSAIVNSTVLARICGPELRALGYEKKLVYGTIAASGMLGILIPPSLFAVVFAMLTEQSVGKLLMSTIGIGALATFLMCATVIAQCYLNPSVAGGTVSASWRERIVGLKGLWIMALVAVIIIGGIFLGVFTATEAAAVATAAMFTVGLCRRMPWEKIRQALSESIGSIGMIFLLLISAQIFSRFEVISGLTPRLVDLLVGMGVASWQVIVLILVALLIIGCFVDAMTAMILVVPMTFPLITTMKIDPIWFGALICLVVNIGGLTPPVGLLVFATKAVAGPDVSVEDVFRGALPQLIVLLVVTAIVVVFPPIATWIPSMMAKG
jgi:C4-dicarboxylate transporter DctM subunit